MSFYRLKGNLGGKGNVKEKTKEEASGGNSGREVYNIFRKVRYYVKTRNRLQPVIEVGDGMGFSRCDVFLVSEDRYDA